MTTEQLVRAWADDLFLHGSALARWITDYVDLEESLAVGSMAQEDVAHAARLLELCGVDPHARDELIYVRPAEEWLPSRATAWTGLTWPETVARAFLVSAAFRCLVDELVALGDESVAETARVIAAEQDMHLRHWSRWVQILARTPATSKDLDVALAEALERSADLFGDVPAQAVAGDGRLPDLDAGMLHERWRADVTATLHGSTDAAVAAQPQPRRHGGELAALRATLERLRSVRRGQPDFRYEIYS